MNWRLIGMKTKMAMLERFDYEGEVSVEAAGSDVANADLVT